LVTDAAGRLWVGTIRNSVYRWDEGGWTRFPATFHPHRRPGVPVGWVEALCIDHQQLVWASTSGGLANYRDGCWGQVDVRLMSASAQDEARAWPLGDTSLHLDARGRLWLGSWHGDIGWLDTTQPLPALEQAPAEGS
jgi:ligand-binding sensor domain-containing protein